MNAVLQLPTRFGLIRHAQTVWNRENRIQGQLDSALTAAGRKQAEDWGRILKKRHWDRCLCSDLERARATAAIITRTMDVPVSFESGLREQDWGRWSGLTPAQLRHGSAADRALLARHGWQFKPPGGEDRKTVSERAAGALKAAAAKWPGESILVVTHEGLIRCLIYRLLNRRYVAGEPRILRSAHLHFLVCRRDRLSVEELNSVDLGGA